MNGPVHQELGCGIAGWGVARVAWHDVAAVRKTVTPGLKAHAHLKTADEQTVVAWTALRNACERAGWAPTAFTDWAVLAAPTYIGRLRVAPSFRRFHVTGARGVSPLIIPTISNHSVAGTLCLILGSHGPNFGVGGSTPLVEEVLLNALALCDGQRCPGVWALMTAFDPEPTSDDDGKPTQPTVCVGVALALVPQHAAGALRYAAETPSSEGTIFELADFLEAGAADAWRCPLAGGGVLELSPGATAASAPLRKAS